MKLNANQIKDLVSLLSRRFPSFGGGDPGERASYNPISHALKNEPAAFAAGVDIEEVVCYVLAFEEALANCPHTVVHSYTYKKADGTDKIIRTDCSHCHTILKQPTERQWAKYLKAIAQREGSIQ